MTGRQYSIHSKVLVIAWAMTVFGCAPTDEPGGRILGQSWGFGNGTVSTYAEFTNDRVPSAIGLAYSA